MNKIMFRLLSVILAFSLALGSHFNAGAAANTYYVSMSGNDANPGTSSRPWRTVQKALNTASAGDTVNVLAGNYNERVYANKSGSAGYPITFRAQGAAVITGFIIYADYITVDGFEIANNERSGAGVRIKGAYNIIENNYIHHISDRGVEFYAYKTDNTTLVTHDNIVRNNKLQDIGSVGISVSGRNNIVENNEISEVWQCLPINGYCGDADGMYVFGQGHIIRGNYIHDISFGLPGINPSIGDYNDDTHIDCFQSWTSDYFEAASDILFEGNYCDNLQFQNDWEKGQGWMLGQGAVNITIRNNVVRAYRGINTNGEPGGNYLYVYNNTFINNLAFPAQPNVIEIWNLKDAIIKNNIFYNQKDGIVGYLEGDTSGLFLDHNLVYNSDGSLPKNLTYPILHELRGVNPLFINAAAKDYHLQAGSPACTGGENGAYIGAFPCSTVVPTLAPTNTPIIPSATPSSAPSFTPTKIFTPTPVPLTATPTASPTFTATKSPTATATTVPFTPTATATKTAAPTATAAPFTPTATSTNTAAPTITSQPTSTPVTPIVISNGENSVDVRVAKGSDDVEENSSGRMYANSSDLELIYDNSVQVVGIRFTGVSIPAGATITNAYIQFKVDQTDRRTVNLTVAGESNSNASAFSNTARDVSKRTRTSNSVTWAPPSWSRVGETGTSQRTPNLSAIVQEIVNQANWNSGNSIVMIITGNNNGKRVAKSFEGNSAGAPMLHVEFSMPVQAQAAMALLLPATPTPTPTATLLTPLAPPTIMATFTSEPTQIPSSPTMVATEIVISTETPSPTPIPPSPTVEVVVPTETPTSLTPTTQVLTTFTSKTESINKVDVVNGYPVITSNGSLSIVENTTAVTTVTATDADLPTETLTYSIAGGADLALFSINSSTGELTFVANPDFEVPADAGVDNIYNVTVQVSDGMLATTQDITVTVTAVNDNNPVVTSNGSISIAENTTAATAVAATDADLPTETLTYSIAGGADSALFSINSSTGELTFVANPDFEVPADVGVDNIYNVTVQVSDGMLATTQDVTVTVTAVNDNNPLVTSNGSISIAENTTAVTIVTATDADLPTQTLTYSIAGGADSALFNINSSTGELTFVANPDFEVPADAGVDNIYNVTVQVSDGMLATTQDITVTVTAVNDNNPVVTSNGSISIAENTTAVTTITATDADLPTQILTYSIAGGADSALFSINSSTGELTFIAAPDFEIPTDAGMDNVYNITVQVSDGMLSITQDVAVTVTAVNDNNPSVTSNGSISIAENTTTVTTVTATDADLPSQSLTYSIAVGADSALFKINSSTGELTFITAPDFDTPTDAGMDNVYNVKVQASDERLVVAQDIVVTVKGVNQPQ